MEHLIQDVKDEKISQVVVYKLDRLSRSQKDTLYLIEDLFMPHNVDFVSLTEALDTATPMGRAMIGILAAFAQLERENIRMRTRMGMQERVKDGYWMGGGRVPFGYDYDRNQGILVPNKDAEKVKQMYDLYIKGYSAQSISNILGLKYDKLTLQILQRKSNYGVIEYNGTEYQGRHKPIISKETFNLAQEIRKRRLNTKSTSSTRKRNYYFSGLCRCGDCGFGVSGITTAKHLLTGLVYCGKCGAKMRYQNWGKNGQKFVCYSQQKSKAYLIKDPDCNQEKIWCDEVEDKVIKKLFKLKEEKRELLETKTFNTSPIDLLLQQKTTLQKKIKNLYNLYAESEDSLLLDTVKENKKTLEKINKKIELENAQKKNIKSQKNLEYVVDSLEDRWAFMSQKEKQNSVRSLVEKITLTGENIELKLKI